MDYTGGRRGKGEEGVSSEVSHFIGLSSHHRYWSQVGLAPVPILDSSPIYLRVLYIKYVYLYV